MTASPVKLENFDDIVNMAIQRCKGFSARESDINLMKGFINEVYSMILKQKQWPFAKMDRSFVFDLPVTTGTVAVTLDSRVITFTGLTLDKTYLGRSISIDNTLTLYRIIGINTVSNSAYLDTSYVDQTKANATFKIFQYEFPIPPDCSSIEQVYIDSNFIYGARNGGQVDGVNNQRFNRLISGAPLQAGPPGAWCKDGKIQFNAIPPLDEMILNYDFLGGEDTDLADRLRLFPIQPDRKRVIHLSYVLAATPMTMPDHKPIMDKDDWYILVHGGCAEYLYYNNRRDDAIREESKMNRLFKDMCTKFGISDTRPKMVVNAGRYKRFHNSRYSDKQELFYISRQAEYD